MDGMPQESYNYNSNYYYPRNEIWDDSTCLYDDGCLPMLTAAVVVPQPVSSFGVDLEGENLDMELLGPASHVNYNVASPFITSAANKHSYIIDEKEDVHNGWISKPVKQWTKTDIMSWIVAVANDNGIPCEQVILSGFREFPDGLPLSCLTEEEFLKLEPNHGSLLYKALNEFKSRWSCGYENETYRPHITNDPLPAFNTFLGNGDSQTPDSISNWHITSLNSRAEEKVKDEDPNSDAGSEVRPQKIRKAGRRKGDGKMRKARTEKRCGRLWEFIRDLLKDNKHCPNDICWVDHDEGTFRFVKSEKVAKLWGEIKENPKMNYEKLSRAMRYYYKSQVLLPVLGRRLVYKFGPNATNWRSNNPNFRY